MPPSRGPQSLHSRVGIVSGLYYTRLEAASPWGANGKEGMGDSRGDKTPRVADFRRRPLALLRDSTLH